MYACCEIREPQSLMFVKSASDSQTFHNFYRALCFIPTKGIQSRLLRTVRQWLCTNRMVACLGTPSLSAWLVRRNLSLSQSSRSQYRGCPMLPPPRRTWSRSYSARRRSICLSGMRTQRQECQSAIQNQSLSSCVYIFSLVNIASCYGIASQFSPI